MSTIRGNIVMGSTIIQGDSNQLQQEDEEPRGRRRALPGHISPGTLSEILLSKPDRAITQYRPRELDSTTNRAAPDAGERTVHRILKLGRRGGPTPPSRPDLPRVPPLHTSQIGATHPHHLQTPPFQPLTHPHNYPYYKNISAPWQAHPYKKCNTHPNIQKTLPA